MFSGRLVWILGCALGATACIGGQSGTEGRPDIPGGCRPISERPVGLDDVTAAGVARTAFDSLRSPQLAALSWYTHDGTSPLIDTTLTLSISGEAEGASYLEFSDDCLPLLRVTGGTLRFETADGAFQESFPGVAIHSSDGDQFVGTLPISQFAGSYDVERLASPYRNAELLLRTSFSPASGQLSMSGESAVPGSTAAASSIANWTGLGHGGP